MSRHRSPSPRRYDGEWLWSLALGAFLVCGVLAAPLAPRPGALPWCLAVTGIGMGAARLCIDQGRGIAWDVQLARAVRGTVLGTTSLLAFVGLSGLLGAVSVLVLMLLGATHPALLRCVARANLAEAVQPAGQLDAGAHAGPSSCSSAGSAGRLGALPTAALLQAWESSHWTVCGVGSVTARAAAAQRRREYLDELERRDPVGVARWLASGATGARSPRRFVGATAPADDDDA